MRTRSSLISALSCLLLCLPSSATLALTVEYTALDLPDVTPGVDRWQYAYTVSAGGFVPFGGLSLLYAPALYAGLAVSTEPAAADWMTPSLVIDPDPGLAADGVVTLTALTNVDAASFVVDFDWLGTGSPGAQGFEKFDDFFTTVASGQTTAAGSVVDVPTPGALALLLGGSLWVRRRRIG